MAEFIVMRRRHRRPLLLIWIYILWVSSNNIGAANSAEPSHQTPIANSSQIRRSPVPIYKGSEPWRPLSNAKAFGVKRVISKVGIPESAEDDVQPRQNAAPNVPVGGEAESINAESIDEAPESVNKEQQPQLHEAGNRKHFKIALHESLRRPLKRLTDRQLALLLKQIRRQRQRQYSRESKEAEQQPDTDSMSRQEMLDQIRELLPQDGQRLLRPKLLTNVNVLPSEWAIYPPPRRPGLNKDGTVTETTANGTQPAAEGSGAGGDQTAAANGTQQGIEIDGNLYNLFGDSAQQQQNATTTAATEQPTTSATVTEVPTTTTTLTDATTTTPTDTTTVTEETTTTVTTTVSADQQPSSTVTLPIEMRATIRPPIVHSVELTPLETATTGTGEATRSGDVRLENGKEQTSSSLAAGGDETPNATNGGGEVAKTIEQLVAEQPEQNQQPENNQNVATLEAGWKVVEQKFAAEMRDAMKNADAQIEKLQKQRKEAEKEQKEKDGTSAVAFSSKTLHPAAGVDSANGTSFVQQERAQLGELSASLRAIRLRYEAVKRQFQNKMRRLGLAHRFQGGSVIEPPEPSSKASGTRTFFDGMPQDQNATLESANIGANLNLPENHTDEHETSTLGGLSDTVTNQTSEDADTVTIPATSVEDITKNAKTKNQGTSEKSKKTKAKPKLTLAELAEELEQIERAIAEEDRNAETDGVQNAKNGKKMTKQQNRARVFSSPASEAANTTAAGEQPISATIVATKRGPLPASATSKKTHHHQKAQKQAKEDGEHDEEPKTVTKHRDQQQHKNDKPVQHPEANRRRILTTTTTDVGSGGGLRSVLVDTSTERLDADTVVQLGSEDEEAETTVAQKQRSEGRVRTQLQQHQPIGRGPANLEASIAASTSTEQQPRGFLQQPPLSQQQQQQQFPINGQHQIPHNNHPQQPPPLFGQHAPQHNEQRPDGQFVAAQLVQDQQHGQFGQQSQTQNGHQQNIQPQRKQFVQQQNVQSFGQQPQHGIQHPPQQQFVAQQQQSLQHAQQEHPHLVGQQQQQPVTQQTNQQQPVIQHPQQQLQQVQQRFGQHPQQQQQPQLVGQQQLGRTNLYNQPHVTPAQTTARGFYQLEHAQVTNVSPKSPGPLPPPPPPPQQKGVSQVEIAENVDQELSNAQLSNQLRKEMLRNNRPNKKLKQHNKQNGTSTKSRGGGDDVEDLENLEEFARIDEQTICDAIACNFEAGTLCEWETSIDELKPNDRRYRSRVVYRRIKRQQMTNNDSVNDTNTVSTETPNKQNDTRIIIRSWHNWVGRYRNRLTGIARAEVFSTSNQRFGATYVKPGQRSTLTGRLLSGERATIRFQAWEATRDIQLRVCCDRTDQDDKCVFETEKGVKRGSRKWKDYLATCPLGTKKIIFECRNLGEYQGACGVDNIQLVNEYCPSVTPMKANRMV